MARQAGHHLTSRAAMICLLWALFVAMPRDSLAIETHWVSPTSGEWSDAARWSPSVPRTSDIAIIGAAGHPYTINARAVSISASELRLLASEARVEVLTFNFSFGRIENDGTLAVLGMSVPSQLRAVDLVQRGNLIINGSENRAEAVIQNSVVNDGVITLVAPLRPSWDTSLRVENGSVFNSPSGRIVFAPGGALQSLWQAPLINEGRIDVESSVMFAGFINGPPTSVVNRGTVTVASGQTLDFTARGVWNQEAGLLDVDGVILGRSSSVFNINGGNVSGEFDLTRSNVHFSGNTTGDPRFTLHDSGQITGRVPSGARVELGTSDASAGFEAPNGLINAGIITMNGIDTAWRFNGGAPFKNEVTGKLVFNGTTFSGSATRPLPIPMRLDNGGEIEINSSTHIELQPGDSAFVNSGAIRVASGNTLSLEGGNFHQQAGSITGGGAVFSSASRWLHIGGDVLTPIAMDGTLDYSQYVDGIGVYAFNAASGRIVGDIPRGHAISMRGTTTRINMTLTPGATNFGVISLGSTPTAGSVLSTQNLVNRGRIVSLPSVQGNSIGPLTNHGHVDVQATLGINQLVNHGTISVASNAVLSLGSLESIQAAGELIVEGHFVSVGGRLRFDGGTIEVTGSASVRTLEVNAPGLTGTIFVEDVQYGPGAGGTATFRLLGNSAFRGTVPAGHTLLLEPDPGSPPSSINVLGTNVINGGRIQIPAGTLSQSGMIPFINGPTGSLIVGGGQLPVLQNEGLIEINGAANLFNVTNLGTFVVAGTATATMSNNGVFTHNRGKVESRGMLRGANLALEVNSSDLNGNFDLGGGRLTYGAGAGGIASITSIGALSGTVPHGHSILLGSMPTHSISLTDDVINRGTIRVGGVVSPNTGKSLTNAADGLLVLQTGRVNGIFRNEGVVRATGTSLLGTLVNHGALELQGARLGFTTPSFVNSPDGSVTGIGSVDGSNFLFRNEGMVSPGSGTGLLTIGGRFVQAPGGTFHVDIAGRAPGVLYDQLIANTSLVLDGSLAVSLLDGFSPLPNDVFTIMQSPNPALITTHFANAESHVVFEQGQFDVVYGRGIVQLTNFRPIPEPATCVMAVVALLGILAAWRGSAFRSGGHRPPG